MAERKLIKPHQPVEGMSETDWFIFQQQAAQEAMEMGIVKLTPENSTEGRPRDDDNG